MFNPFLQTEPRKKRWQIIGGNEESTAQKQGRILDSMPEQPSMGLWMCRLLIRMGKKLAREDTALKSAREHA